MTDPDPTTARVQRIMGSADNYLHNKISCEVFDAIESAVREEIEKLADCIQAEKAWARRVIERLIPAIGQSRHLHGPSHAEDFWIGELQVCLGCWIEDQLSLDEPDWPIPVEVVADLEESHEEIARLQADALRQESDLVLAREALAEAESDRKEDWDTLRNFLGDATIKRPIGRIIALTERLQADARLWDWLQEQYPLWCLSIGSRSMSVTGDDAPYGKSIREAVADAMAWRNND